MIVLAKVKLDGVEEIQGVVERRKSRDVWDAIRRRVVPLQRVNVLDVMLGSAVKRLDVELVRQEDGETGSEGPCRRWREPDYFDVRAQYGLMRRYIDLLQFRLFL